MNKKTRTFFNLYPFVISRVKKDHNGKGRADRRLPLRGVNTETARALVRRRPAQPEARHHDRQLSMEVST